MNFHMVGGFYSLLMRNAAAVANGATPDRGHFVAAGDFDLSSLPTVMRKAATIALSAPVDD